MFESYTYRTRNIAPPLPHIQAQPSILRTVRGGVWKYVFPSLKTVACRLCTVGRTAETRYRVTEISRRYYFGGVFDRITRRTMCKSRDCESL